MADMSEAQQLDFQALNLAILQAGEVPCAGDDLMISDREEDQAEGAHWCARCPILDQCRTYGLGWPKEEGVFGGVTRGQRLQRLSSPRKRTPKEPPSPEEIERRRALVRERSRRARARKKQRQNGEIAC